MSAIQLPNGRQQFTDGNGIPFAFGTVTFYAPSTTTPKDTWQDVDQVTLNTNPITLDADGYATIWGEGLYRQILRDASNNLIWDQVVGTLPQTADATQYGVIPDADNNTAPIQALADMGLTEEVFFPAGVYWIDQVTVTLPIHWRLSPAAIFKSRTALPDGGSMLLLSAGSDDSTLVGGKYAGNKSALKADYAGASYLVRIESASVVFQPNIIQNAVQYGLWVQGDDFTTLGGELRFDNCGVPMHLGHDRTSAGDTPWTYRPNIGDIVATGTNNDGVDFNQHNVEFTTTREGSIGRVVMTSQTGDTSGQSTFCSGWTVTQCEEMAFAGALHTGMLTETLIHVPVSLVGCRRCDFGEVQVFNFAGTGVELSTCQACTGTFYSDGMYRGTAAKTLDSSNCINLDGAGFYRDTSRRAINADENSEYTFVAYRSGTGVQMDGDNIVATITAEGNTTHGVNVLASTWTNNFPGSRSVFPRGIQLRNPRIRFNGLSGVHVSDASEIVINGGMIAGNGQDVTGSAPQRSDVYCTYSSLNNATVSVLGTQMGDRQTWTRTAALSYRPGSTDANNQYVFWRIKPFDVGYGQWLNLVGVVSGPGDALGKVVDIYMDTITLQFASPTTFVDPSAIINLTGTVSSSGQAVTGAGTAFDTEITGPGYLKASGQYQSVEIVTGATALSTAASFTPALSGATGQIVACDVQAVPSTQHSVKFAGTMGAWSLQAVDWGLDTLDNEFDAGGNLGVGAVNSTYPQTGLAVAFTALATVHPMITGLPFGHRPLSAAATNTTTWTGAVSETLDYYDATDTKRIGFATFGALTTGTHASGLADTFYQLTTNGNYLAITTGSAPSAGAANVRLFMRVEAQANVAF